MRRCLFEMTKGTPSRTAICALVEFLAGLDYARTPRVGRLQAIASVYRPEHRRYVTHFVEKLEGFRPDDLNCWFRMRALTMDLYTALVIANATTPYVFFYGGANHTKNVAAALKAAGRYGVYTPLQHTERGFELEVLTNEQNQKVICLGEDHFRTAMSHAKRLIKWAKKMCKGPACTLLIEKHLKFEHEEAASFPNEMACDSTDRMAIQKARCDPVMTNMPCQNVTVKFVDNRHCDLGFFRGPEIGRAAPECHEFRKAYVQFQTRALRDSRTSCAALRVQDEVLCWGLPSTSPRDTTVSAK